MSTLENRNCARSKGAKPVTVVGARFHGDFQGLENWSDERDTIDELAAAGIKADFDYHAVSQGTVYDCRGKHCRIRSQQPLYYLVRRGDGRGRLDRDLLRQATEAGVKVMFGDRASDDQGTTILAIVPWLADAIAVGCVFETEMPDGSWLVLDKELAPLGYAYLLILSGRGTVASCMFAGFKRQAEYVARTVAFFLKRADLDMRNPRPFGRLPISGCRGPRCKATIRSSVSKQVFRTRSRALGCATPFDRGCSRRKAFSKKLIARASGAANCCRFCAPVPSTGLSSTSSASRAGAQR